MNIDFPYHFDIRGRTASAGQDKHIRDLIEAVLFTTPGERVNRPTFGSGLMQLIFSPNSDILASATQLTVQSALQQWLGDLIKVEEVQVTGEDSTIRIVVKYVVLKNQERKSEEFRKAI